TNKFAAALIAFSLNSGAYLAEIVRAAIQSIDKGQLEASRALGMTYGQAMRQIIIPQSYRRLIPPLSNEFIMVLKDTALVSAIALTDLMRTTNLIQTRTGSALVYVPAMLLYLIMTTLFTFVAGKLEKRFAVYD
ncbi:MAG TPA: amino acid ABC transporter permease, partial [Clostridia bacterium]